MKNWISKNYKLLIIGAFLVPIFTVALVSISHVTKWYGISNPVSWAIYLSIGIEIAALSTLAAISADMGKKVYFPFGLVTLVQFIGNIYFAYSFIDIDSKSFRDWIDLVSPMVEFMGVDNTDLVGHKRFLAFFAGGMLPIISLSFLHMLVKFTEEDRKKQQSTLEPPVQPVIDIEKISREAGIIEAEIEKNEKYTPTEEELEKIEEFINKTYNKNKPLTGDTVTNFVNSNDQNKKENNEPNKNITNNTNSHNTNSHNTNDNNNEYVNKNNSNSSNAESDSQNFSTNQSTTTVKNQEFSTNDNKKENIFQNKNTQETIKQTEIKNLDNQTTETTNTQQEVVENNLNKTEETIQQETIQQETIQQEVKNENVLESTQINEEEEKKN